MKTFAYYLPQYHCIPENDQWWGKGFTEWVNVKNATPLFNGHNQPKIPLNENYYNLLDKDTVIWQTKLMQDYHIDGLIYYHYYFNGKLLLEKPAENLLKWKEIKQNFFFCWANHPWIRSWEGKKEVIMPLSYGDVNDWEKHFIYLLDFFKDDRYEKKDNKPLFCIYKSDFEEKNDIFKYFDKRCKEEGFAGIYLIETFSGELPFKEFLNNTSPITDRVVFREPSIQIFAWHKTKFSVFRKVFNRFLNFMRNKNIYRKPRIYNGADLMRLKIDNYVEQQVEIPCVWFEWDNTPRHKQRGYIITPYNQDLFNEYMKLISNKDYLFINAWNEWAEGMFLEPTEDYGYKYLKWVSDFYNKSSAKT